ncbi:MAG: hypothetical protein WCU88_09000 [Elusimicrobiota bacterium]
MKKHHAIIMSLAVLSTVIFSGTAPAIPGARLAAAGNIDIGAYIKTVASQGWSPVIQNVEVPTLSGLKLASFTRDDAASSEAFQRLTQAAFSVGGVFNQLPAQRQLLGLADLPCRTFRTDQDERHFSFFVVSETPKPDIIIMYLTTEGGTLFLTDVNGKLRKALDTDFKNRNQFLDLTPEVQTAFQSAKSLWIEQADAIFGSHSPSNASL